MTTTESETKKAGKRRTIPLFLWMFALFYTLLYACMPVVGAGSWVNAMRAHDQAALRRYLALPVSPDFLGLKGNTPLYYATQSGERETARVLLARGANPIQGIKGLLRFNRLTLEMRQQLWQDFKPFVLAEVSSGSFTPKDYHWLLECALELQDWNSAEQFVRQGADVNFTAGYGHRSFIMSAAQEGDEKDIRIAGFLLRHGAQANACEPSSPSALVVAAEAGNKVMIKLLKDNGATE